MKLRILTSLLFLILIVSAGAEEITLPQLFADQKSWNEKTITVSGVVKGYYEKPNFASCLLLDGGKGVCLYLKPGSKLSNDQKLTVTGPFLLRYDSDGRVFSNVILVDQELPAAVKE